MDSFVWFVIAPRGLHAIISKAKGPQLRFEYSEHNCIVVMNSAKTKVGPFYPLEGATLHHTTERCHDNAHNFCIIIHPPHHVIDTKKLTHSHVIKVIYGVNLFLFRDPFSTSSSPGLPVFPLGLFIHPKADLIHSFDIFRHAPAWTVLPSCDT